MCGIFGSFDRDEFLHLANVNSYRGSRSYSISLFHNNKVRVISRGDGAIQSLPNNTEGLLIGHQRAPTADNNYTHPAFSGTSHLWHNGIIKINQIEEWQREYNTQIDWDTQLLANLIDDHGYSFLNDIDGSFACVHLFNSVLNIFRNSNCPLFVKGSSFSSTKIDNFTSIKAGVIYTLQDEWKETNVKFKDSNQFFWSM